MEKGRVPCVHCSSPAWALSARRPGTTAGSKPATVAASPSATLTPPPSRPSRHRRTGTSRSIRLLAAPVADPPYPAAAVRAGPEPAEATRRLAARCAAATPREWSWHVARPTVVPSRPSPPGPGCWLTSHTRTWPRWPARGTQAEVERTGFAAPDPATSAWAPPKFWSARRLRRHLVDSGHNFAPAPCPPACSPMRPGLATAPEPQGGRDGHLRHRRR
jgi:hypothetical protein